MVPTIVIAVLAVIGVCAELEARAVARGELEAFRR